VVGDNGIEEGRGVNYVCFGDGGKVGGGRKPKHYIGPTRGEESGGGKGQQGRWATKPASKHPESRGDWERAVVTKEEAKNPGVEGDKIDARRTRRRGKRGRTDMSLPAGGGDPRKTLIEGGK